MRKDVQVGVENNGYWLGQLGLVYRHGLDPNEISRSLDRINALNATNVQAAAKRYLKSNQRFKAVLLPEG